MQFTESPSVCFYFLFRRRKAVSFNAPKLFRISYWFIIAFFLLSMTTLFFALLTSLFRLLLSFFFSLYFNQNVLAWKTLKRKIPHILEGILVAFHLTWKIQTAALLEALWWLSLLCSFPLLLWSGNTGGQVCGMSTFSSLLHVRV